VRAYLAVVAANPPSPTESPPLPSRELSPPSCSTAFDAFVAVHGRDAGGGGGGGGGGASTDAGPPLWSPGTAASASDSYKRAFFQSPPPKAPGFSAAVAAAAAAAAAAPASAPAAAPSYAAPAGADGSLGSLSSREPAYTLPLRNSAKWYTEVNTDLLDTARRLAEWVRADAAAAAGAHGAEEAGPRPKFNADVASILNLTVTTRAVGDAAAAAAVLVATDAATGERVGLVAVAEVAAPPTAAWRAGAYAEEAAPGRQAFVSLGVRGVLCEPPLFVAGSGTRVCRLVEAHPDGDAGSVLPGRAVLRGEVLRLVVDGVAVLVGVPGVPPGRWGPAAPAGLVLVRGGGGGLGGGPWAAAVRAVQEWPPAWAAAVGGLLLLLLLWV